jgi:tetratricopeptide (TPR) repeat protein
VKPFEPTKRAIVRNGLLGLIAAAGCAFAGALDHGPRHRVERSWQDIESRIQYGYFTEDARALNSLRQQLPGAAEDKLRAYYGALLAYRLTQVLVRPQDSGQPGQAVADSAKGQGRELLDRCVAALDPVLAADREFAEGFALQAACLGLAADLDMWWRALVTGVRSGSQLRRAVQLAPGNPRVLLLQAASDSGRAGGDKALAELKRAIAAFEAERGESAHLPAWGAPEAYVLEARIYLKRGDAVRARDSLERALLLAPDYAQARRLLLRITSPS